LPQATPPDYAPKPKRRAQKSGRAAG
jgi:hypothetical protein